jgi:hypothetical protein
MSKHEAKKALMHDFTVIWERLRAANDQSFQTPRGNSFEAFATTVTDGSYPGDRVIIITEDSKEIARIYSCCWGHTTNCYETPIGDYSDALDRWANNPG